jgi:hypothetical protein
VVEPYRKRLLFIWQSFFHLLKIVINYLYCQTRVFYLFYHFQMKIRKFALLTVLIIVCFTLTWCNKSESSIDNHDSNIEIENNKNEESIDDESISEEIVEEPVIQKNILLPEVSDTPVAKMRIEEWQSVEETQALIENTCANLWGEWEEWACVLDDWAELYF